MFYRSPWRIRKVFVFFAQVPVDRVVVDGSFYFSNAAYGENVFKIGIVQNGPAQVFGIDCLDNAVFEELFQVDGYDVGAMYQRVQIRVPEGVGRSGFGQGTNGAQPAGERIFKLLHDAGRVFRPG